MRTLCIRPTVTAASATVATLQASHWGTLIDNLRLATEMRSAGVGRPLLAGEADTVATRGREYRSHLRVFEANVHAPEFHARLGRTEVERVVKSVADGSAANALRVTWDDHERLRTVAATS
jgi:hypothetical protein